MAETEAAKRSLSDIEARHADIIRLEKSIQEMKELFFNVALLVDQQCKIICIILVVVISILILISLASAIGLTR
ncbi:unnamed protein product [Schistosoma curassoni]|uniref:SynN domain-containing protein n=1 Tax=Schistosoma curassoni TaxID=6186 RepID=A0A183KIG6_9TREM|nr:unnamed protein product [Schistosoma curassoni]